MTNIIFSDLFHNESEKKFKIAKDDVSKTIRAPDDLNRIKLDTNYQLLHYIKKFDSGYTLLVECQLRNDQCVVGYVYKIFPELMQEIGSTEPIRVLEGFANKFGLNIRIGNFQGKCVPENSFPIPPGATPQQIVGIDNPSDHSFIQSMMMRVRNEGGTQFLDVSLAYCIDTEMYSDYLS